MSQYLVLNSKDFKWINTHSFIYNKVTFIDTEMLSELLEISKETIFQFRCKNYLRQYDRINRGTLIVDRLPLATYYQLNRYNIVLDGKYYYPLEYVKMCARFKKDVVDALYVISRIMEEIKNNITNNISGISNYLKSEFNLSLDLSQKAISELINNNKGVRFNKCVDTYNALLKSGVVQAYEELEIDFKYVDMDIAPHFKDIIDNNIYSVNCNDINSVSLVSTNPVINGTIYLTPSKCASMLSTTKVAFITRVNNPVIGHYDNVFIKEIIRARIYHDGKSYYPADMVITYTEELIVLKDYLKQIVDIINNLVANNIKTKYLAGIAGVSTMVIRNIVYKKNTKINNIISLTKALRNNAQELNIKVPEAPTNLRFFNLG